MAITNGANLGLMVNGLAGESHYDEFIALLRGLDGLVMCHVKTIGNNTPAASPSNGDCHVCGAAPTGLWAGHANQIARWNGTVWEFFTPKNGWAVIYETGQTEYRYNGTAWSLASGGSATVQDYSTTEQNTGQKDVNGYDIYWKSVFIAALPNSTTLTQAHGISNIRKVIRFDAFFNDTANANIIPGSYVYPPNPSLGLGISVNLTNVIMVSGNNRTDFSGYVTIWYTKTV